MPNVKLFVDETLYAERRAALRDALEPLRETLCQHLEVGPEACQIAVLPVLGLPDQPPINVEIHLMPASHRTRERLFALAEALRTHLREATGGRTAVRIGALDPATYVALK